MIASTAPVVSRRVAPAADSSRAIDYRALAELRYRMRCFLSFSEREARAAGVEPQQHQLLLAVMGLPPDQRPTIATLAERMQLRHHTVVGLIDRLVARKLARRQPSASDGREILLRLTPKGERLVSDLSLLHRDELEHAGRALIRALQAVLDRSKWRSRQPTRTGAPRRAARAGRGRA
jgi:DNA-binding MarR family transcriptional regulator